MNQILIAAIAEAIKSDDNYLVGAVVHNKSKILSSGHNDSGKTHPEAQHGIFNRGHHAELSARKKIRHYGLRNLEITVIIILRCDGSFTMAMPCVNCMRIIEEFGIKKIHYSTWNGTIATIERKNERKINSLIVEIARQAVGIKN